MSARPAPRRPFLSYLLLPSLVLNAILLGLALRHATSSPPSVSPAPAPPSPSSALNSQLPTLNSSAASPAPTGPLRAFAAVGSFVAENNRIADLGWSEAQFAAFQHGLRASYEGRGYPLDDDGRALRDDLSRRVATMLEAERPDPIADYFKTLRDREGVQRTSSGLHYRVTEPGDGAPATAADTVVLSFTGRLPDGTALASLAQARVRTAVADLLPGLREGVQLLPARGKALLYLPPDLSFGDGVWPADIPRGAPVVLFVELHEIAVR